MTKYIYCCDWGTSSLRTRNAFNAAEGMLLVALLLFPCIHDSYGQEKNLPNIIVIMADDLGYNDLASYGQTIFATPYTDKLAKQGMRLTRAYSPSAICSPTRYAVLTGTDPFRAYHHSHVLFNGEPLVIEENEWTIASLLKRKGYHTGIIGKWHLGLGDSLPRDINSPGRGPNERTLEKYFKSGASRTGAKRTGRSYAEIIEEKDVRNKYIKGIMPDHVNNTN